MSHEARPAESEAPGSRSFVFVSYALTDVDWATWIAEVLESAGIRTSIQAWDSRPGQDFVAWIMTQLATARWTVAVYSPAYFASRWCTAELTSSLARQTLLPVRIVPIEPPPPLDTVTWVDLFGLDEEAARAQLLRAVQVRVLPRLAVAGFPGGRGPHGFPGPAPGQGRQPAPVYLPDFITALADAQEQLASPTRLVRLAGVHALESLAAEAAQPAAAALVAEVLAGAVRDGLGHADRVTAVRAIGRLPDPHPCDLSGAELWQVTLTGVNLGEVRLRKVHLSGARLNRARLVDADLTQADLNGVDLADADLTRARLCSADLQDAGLERAILIDADLFGANSHSLRLGGATWSVGTRWPSTTVPRSVREVSRATEVPGVFVVDRPHHEL